MNCNNALKWTCAFFFVGVLCLNSVVASGSGTKDKNLTELTVVAQPAAGGVVSGAGKYVKGSVVDVRAIPAKGYVFSRWVGNVVNRASMSTQTYVGSNPHQIVAVFEPERHLLSVKIVPSSAGMVEGAGYVPNGVAAQIYAQPAPGYEFDRWEGEVANATSASTILRKPVSGPVALTAHFKPVEEFFTITVVADPVAGGRVSRGGKFKRGEVVTLKAEAGSKHRFVGWSGRVASMGRAETTIYVAEDATIIANFAINKSLVGGKVSPEGAGMVEGKFGAMPVGEPIPIRAVAAPGYAFVRWDGPVENRAKIQTTITPAAGKTATVTAVFERIK